MNSLMFPTYITYYDSRRILPDVRVFYRLLILANVEKSFIRDLIKTTMYDQNRTALVAFFLIS